MKIKLAILTNVSSFNESRKTIFELNEKYNTNMNSAYLPQHISLKESFQFDGDIHSLTTYLDDFFAKIKPFYVYMDKININIINKEEICASINITDNPQLKSIHNNLCQELKSKFQIESIGFDGDNFKFNSNLLHTKVDSDTLNDLFINYNNKDFAIGFNVQNVAMFCNINDNNEYSDFFTYKIFETSV